MDEPDKTELMKEYVRRFEGVFKILELTGICRFIVRNGKIVERNWRTMLYNICIIILGDACATYLLWFSDVKDEKYLCLVEYIAIMQFSIFSNLLMCNITFGDKYRGLDLIQNSIDIDNVLGAKETEFMREIAMKYYTGLLIFVGICQTFLVAYMYYVFNVTIAIHVVGTAYFFWLCFAYDDICYFIYSYSFLTMRLGYLNVALLKYTNMKMEYIPKLWLFNVMFWKDEYNDRVTFHTRCNTKDFCVALRMLFDQLHKIQQCYRYTIMLCVIVVATGSFVAVQTFIMYIQTSDDMMVRANVIAGWSVISWLYLLTISLQADLFYRQAEQTKLICAYIQLKPNTSAEILRLTKDIFNMLQVRDARISLYDMFFFDTGLLLRIAASTFVYITVQLQLAFPNLKEVHQVENVTTTPFTLITTQSR